MSTRLLRRSTDLMGLIPTTASPGFREELLFNCGGSVCKTIHATDPDATPEQVKDAVLCNHSNLRTVSQRASAYQSIQQKPGEALQTYNTRYASYFKLAYPYLHVNDNYTRTQCTHYVTSQNGKLSDEMTGRFNQDLPGNLQAAFKKAVNFKPHIITKQNINERKVNEVNQINVSQC